MKKQRVLHVTEAWGNGGIETFVVNAIRSTTSEDVHHRVFSVYQSNVMSNRGLAEMNVPHTIAFDKDPGLGVRAALGPMRFLLLLRRERPDVVHIHTMNSLGFVYAWLARWFGVGVRIVHSHNSSFGSGLRILKSAVNGICRLFCDPGVVRVACSRSAGRYLFGTETFDVVANAIDVEGFAYSPQQRAAVRQELGIGDEEFVLGSVGRLSAQKNPSFLVDVCAALAIDGVEHRFIHVGDGELRHAVEERVEARGLTERFLVLGGRSDVSRILSAMDVFLLPSAYEGLPIAIVEAQASGLPCVTSNAVSDESHIVPGMVTAVPVSDVHAWSKRIGQIHHARMPERLPQATEIGAFSLSGLRARLLALYLGEGVQ